MAKDSFEWDPEKDFANQTKHGVSFAEAQHAFANAYLVIARDLSHRANEERYFCFGEYACGILTVRFTYRRDKIRIFGAGYWRKGKQIYERENKILR